MFKVLDPYLSLRPHGPQARVVYRSPLAHLPQPLFIWKADASRLSLLEHGAPGLLSSGADPSSWGGGRWVGV